SGNFLREICESLQRVVTFLCYSLAICLTIEFPGFIRDLSGPALSWSVGLGGGLAAAFLALSFFKFLDGSIDSFETEVLHRRLRLRQYHVERDAELPRRLEADRDPIPGFVLCYV